MTEQAAAPLDDDEYEEEEFELTPELKAELFARLDNHGYEYEDRPDGYRITITLGSDEDLEEWVRWNCKGHPGRMDAKNLQFWLWEKVMVPEWERTPAVHVSPIDAQGRRSTHKARAAYSVFIAATYPGQQPLEPAVRALSALHGLEDVRATGPGAEVRGIYARVPRVQD